MSHLPTLSCVALVWLLPIFLIGGLDAVFGARGAVQRLGGLILDRLVFKLKTCEVC